MPLKWGIVKGAAAAAPLTEGRKARASKRRVGRGPRRPGPHGRRPRRGRGHRPGRRDPEKKLLILDSFWPPCAQRAHGGLVAGDLVARYLLFRFCLNAHCADRNNPLQLEAHCSSSIVIAHGHINALIALDHALAQILIKEYCILGDVAEGTHALQRGDHLLRHG